MKHGPGFRDRVFLCLYGTKSSCPSETIHHRKANSFRGNNLAEDCFHPFLIQPAKNIEQPVGNLRGIRGRTDIMGMTAFQILHML